MFPVMRLKHSRKANQDDSPDEAELRRRIDSGSQDPEDYRSLAHLLGDIVKCCGWRGQAAFS